MLDFMMTAIDDGVAELLALLDELDLTERALVIFEEAHHSSPDWTFGPQAPRGGTGKAKKK